MGHQRKDIRAKVVDLLKAGPTRAGNRVYSTRFLPDASAELPAITVYTMTETVESTDSSAPLELARTVQVAVECAIDAASVPDGKMDDAIDDFAGEVERALMRDPGWGGTASVAKLDGTEMDVDELGERTVGLLRLTFAATYRTMCPPEPLTGLDDFVSADVTHSASGAAAEDIVTINPEG